MKVKDVIAGQTLRTTSPNQKAGVAYAQMEEWSIGALAVFDGEEFVGIITTSNFAAAAFGQHGDEVRHFMTPAKDIIFAHLEDTLKKCGGIMNDKHFHHMPVKDENGKVGWMISALDLQKGLEEEKGISAQEAEELPPG